MSGPSTGTLHRHGAFVHVHPYARPHRHLRRLHRSQSVGHDQDTRTNDISTTTPLHEHDHAHGEHGHSHGLVDRSIVRSHEGVKAVAISLVILGVAAAAQLAIFALSGSVALLADLIHNFGDALTAIPLGIAFYLRSVRGERLAGLAVVLAIFVSACVALYVTIMRFIHPQHLTHLWVLAAAGLIGFAGNELAARVRLSAGKRLASAAMTADGKHARIDGFVSLGVVASAVDGRARRADRRPDHRPRDHPRHPPHHLAVLAHGSARRDRPPTRRISARQAGRGSRLSSTPGSIGTSYS